MDVRRYRAAPSAYLVFASITAALSTLWLGAAWKAGVVTWGPLVLLAAGYALTVLWLSRFRLSFEPDELRVVTPFRGERRLARADILAVELGAPGQHGDAPFTLRIRVRTGADMRLNAKLFTPEAVASLLALAPVAPCAASSR